DEHTRYPVCIKVVHQPPMENSRGEWLEKVWTDNHPEHFWDNDENEMEKDTINDWYASLGEEEPTDTLELWGMLYDLADKLKQLAPWEWNLNSTIFAVIPRDQQRAFYCGFSNEEDIRGLIINVEPGLTPDLQYLFTL